MEGDLVLVPFVGSGTECLAALMEDRSYLGFELNPEYIAIANKRIHEWKNQLEPTFDFP